VGRTTFWADREKEWIGMVAQFDKNRRCKPTRPTPEFFTETLLRISARRERRSTAHILVVFSSTSPKLSVRHVSESDVEKV
jgi:hypothetical protein